MDELIRLLTIDDIARHLHTSHATTVEWLSSMQVPYIALNKGDAGLFRVRDVNQAIEDSFSMLGEGGDLVPVEAADQHPISEESLQGAFDEIALSTLEQIVPDGASDMFDLMIEEGWTAQQIGLLDPMEVSIGDVITPKGRARLREELASLREEE